MTNALALAELPPGLVWRASRMAGAPSALPTGFPQLDAELPGGGWPRGALIELLPERPGVGEIALLLPLLRSTPAERWHAWIAPPWLPYAPALAQAELSLQRLLLIQPSNNAEILWATRQTTISGACTAVLSWPRHTDHAALRRLQLAAEEAATPLFLFRPPQAAQQASAAVLRLRLSIRQGLLAVHILKRRGPPAPHPLLITLPLRPRTASPTPDHALARPAPARPAPAGSYPRRA